MYKHFIKFRKVFTNIACSPLILLSNNSELAAKYLTNGLEQQFITLEISKSLLIQLGLRKSFILRWISL